jgi:hypothetical protein
VTLATDFAWQTFAHLLDPPENRYAQDPVGWVRDRLGEFLWSKQREILEALVRHRYVAVKSAYDTGKVHGASWAVAWWLDTREAQFATTTAPTTSRFTRFCGGTSAKLIERATFLAASRSMMSGTWARTEKSSSPLAASPLITINRRFRASMR